MTDTGRDAISEWRKKFKERKDMETCSKIMESSSAIDYKIWMTNERPENLDERDERQD